jgi:hypothetical protein
MKSKKVSPLFILASERSGTNLLRRRLSDCQSDAFGPPPIQALVHLYELAPFYGDLSDQANFSAISEDLLKLTIEHPAPWEHSLSTQDFISSYTKAHGTHRHITTMVDHLYNIYVRQFGYDSYICKDLELVKYTREILAETPNARFVYLYRDPRDCILSELKRPHQTTSIVLLARKWRDEQVACIGSMSHPVIGSCVMPISYETFIADEQLALRAVCDHAGYRFEGEAKRHGPGEENELHEWKNLESATNTNNSGKFLKELSRRQINMIEAICWAPMQYLGFKPVNDARPRLSRSVQEINILQARLRRGLRSALRRRNTDTDLRFRSMKLKQKIREKLY